MRLLLVAFLFLCMHTTSGCRQFYDGSTIEGPVAILEVEHTSLAKGLRGKPDTVLVKIDGVEVHPLRRKKAVLAPGERSIEIFSSVHLNKVFSVLDFNAVGEHEYLIGAKVEGKEVLYIITDETQGGTPIVRWRSPIEKGDAVIVVPVVY